MKVQFDSVQCMNCGHIYCNKSQIHSIGIYSKDRDTASVVRYTCHYCGKLRIAWLKQLLSNLEIMAVDVNTLFTENCEEMNSTIKCPEGDLNEYHRR